MKLSNSEPAAMTSTATIPVADGRRTRQQLARTRQELRPHLERRLGVAPPAGGPREVLVCAGGACASCQSARTADVIEEELRAAGAADSTRVIRVGCMGLCDAGPLLLVSPDGTYYGKVDEATARRIVAEHLLGDGPVEELEISWTAPDGSVLRSREAPFFARQAKIALRNCGVVDPGSIDEYIALDGYAALERVLFELAPAEAIELLKQSGLRGRGGAGFPTGFKWEFVRDSAGDVKYVVCNGDEGDPGAFMDRSLLEGDPHSVIEGMTIAGRVVGATQGYAYVRAEYPLAIARFEAALADARRAGLLGDDILGTGFSFDIEVRIGAGAFVCGEETALLASIEGRRGMPRPRPPFPAVKGLWDKPTLINNVETYSNLNPIILRGAPWYAAMGTTTSKGTKVFSLAGAVTNTGLVEVPMGISLREVVDEIGGGTRSGRPFKAAQTGGPSGGCIPAAHLDTPIDYKSLQDLGSIMGSGGLVVMDDTTCMVSLARFFMEFCVTESCGKCPPCRIGNQVMLNILDRICAGKGEPDDLERLERLGEHIQRTSLCGLGQTAPNPTLSTLRHFREEYLQHVEHHQCPAKECYPLVDFVIDAELCNGCSSCAKACPSGAIHGEIKHVHVVDQELCIHCGACLNVCPTDAVLRQ